MRLVSVSNDINEIHSEWVYMYKTERELRDGHCICGRAHIKHVHFFINLKNGEIIEVGGGCIKKFSLETLTSTHSRAHNKLLRKFNKLGHPIMDVALPEYLQKVWGHFNEEIDKYSCNEYMLEEIKERILMYMEMKLYNNELMNKLIVKINNILNEKEEREKIYLEKKQRKIEINDRNNRLRNEDKEKLCQLNFGNNHTDETYIDVYNNNYSYIEWLKQNQHRITVSCEQEKFLSWVKNYPVRVIQKGLKYKIEKIREKIRKEKEEKRELEEKIRKERDEKEPEFFKVYETAYEYSSEDETTYEYSSEDETTYEYSSDEDIEEEKLERKREEKLRKEKEIENLIELGTFIAEKFIATRPTRFKIKYELDTYKYFNKIYGGNHCEFNISYKVILEQYMNNEDQLIGYSAF